MRGFMKKFRKQFRYGEKGFTLIELLIVVAILGILAAVIVPNLATFLGTGQVAAANTEVSNVESAALAFYADNDGTWPANTNTDLYNANPDLSYLSEQAIFDYGFDDFGRVDVADTTAWPNDSNVTWSEADHEWQK